MNKPGQTASRRISVSIVSCDTTCGNCRFKFKGENRCELYGDLLPVEHRGIPGSSQRHYKCMKSEIKEALK